MTADPMVSVVIPTRDGRDTLPVTLQSVEWQTYPRELLELIVVEDEGAGAAAARNTGAGRARGSVLVFLDDDIELSPRAVRALVDAHRGLSRAVVVGLLSNPPPSNAFERLDVIRPATISRDEIAPIDFTECYTGLLSITAEDFAACSGFRDPTGGRPSWDDIDFGYRAQGLGIGLYRCASARAVHHDRSAGDLATLCRRWQAGSASAVRLFRIHPGIEDAFPMYRDKLPIRRGDPAPLVVRKLLRSAVSRPPVAWLVRGAAEGMARAGRPALLARPLCGLSVGAAMWRGLRDRT